LLNIVIVIENLKEIIKLQGKIVPVLEIEEMICFQSWI